MLGQEVFMHTHKAVLGHLSGSDLDRALRLLKARL